jgi:hypothetical protein
MYSVLKRHNVAKHRTLPGTVKINESHKKKSRGVGSGERGGYGIGAAVPIHRPEAAEIHVSPCNMLVTAQR